MDIISFIVGTIIGIIIAYIIFNLLNKTKTVNRADYDSLSTKFNETASELKLQEERQRTLQTQNQSLTEKLNAKETEATQLQTKAATLQANLTNVEMKVAELTASFDKELETSKNQQSEINTYKQKSAELTANYNSSLEGLNSYKETNGKQAQQINEFNTKVNQLTAEISKLTANNTALSENLSTSKQTNEKQTQQIDELNTKLNQFISEVNKLTTNNSSLTEKLATQKQEIENMQQTAHFQFEKIANQIFEEKSTKFTEANKTNIETLLNPLKEDIGKFKTKVEETYDKESKQRFSLEERVKELIEQTNKVSSEANNLATALKGQSKKQGNWGEMILERILETSGLTKDREYFVQQTIKDEEGKNLRPDILVKLPDNRVIIIDSKVSLIAYDRFVATENSDEQKTHLAEHLKSIYGHIDDLNGKKYDNLENSLDFTMMFVPIEPAYMASIQADQDLWVYAYSKRILLISPTNLIACLRLISDLWNREKQSKNAMEIVKRGELLYEKFVTFVTSLEDIGKHIGKTQTAYSAAIDQLKSGRGNLVGQAIQLKSLGLKSNKKIPSAMLPLDFEELETSETKNSNDENNEPPTNVLLQSGQTELTSAI